MIYRALRPILSFIFLLTSELSRQSYETATFIRLSSTYYYSSSVTSFFSSIASTLATAFIALPLTPQSSFSSWETISSKGEESKSERVFSQYPIALLIFWACSTVIGSERYSASSLCSFSKTLLTSSRYLILFRIRTGSNCSHASSLVSWMADILSKHFGAIPKVSSQSQQQQPRQVINPNEDYPIFYPLCYDLRVYSATYNSYLISEYEAMKKAMPVKIKLNSPPTYESTVSIFPIVLVILLALVDLKKSTATQRLDEIDTELV